MNANRLRDKSATTTPTTPSADHNDEGMVRGWARFWFTPTPSLGLHIVRFCAGLLFVFWLLPFANHLDDLFGLDGWFDREAYAKGLEKSTPGQRDVGGPEDRGMLEPVIGWSLLYVPRIGGSSAGLAAAYWCSLAVFALFALGVVPRVTGVLSWLAVASFTAGPAIAYDGDGYLLVLAFYLMVGYVLLGQRTRDLGWTRRLFGSWDGSVFARWLGRPSDEARPSLGAALALRLLQVHLAIIMVISGLHKLQFGDWWGGYALWYPFYPAGRATLDQARAHAAEARTYLFFLSAAAYAVLFWQIGFPLFAWRRRWRPVLLVGALIGWLADSFLYELPLMGPALFIGCLAFVTAEEWQALFGLLARVPGLSGLLASPAPAEEEAVEEPEEKAETPAAAVAKEESSTCITVGQS